MLADSVRYFFVEENLSFAYRIYQISFSRTGMIKEKIVPIDMD